MQLRTEVQEHARAEERYEFAHIRRSTDVTNLATMAKAVKAVKAAEAMAPSRPYPRRPVGHHQHGPRLGGRPHGLVDRTKDAVQGHEEEPTYLPVTPTPIHLSPSDP
ncbi:hypothetical protein [Streptomyces sp. NPDC003393]